MGAYGYFVLFGVFLFQSAGAAPLSKIEHLVVVVQENHSFDSYFGKYGKAPPGSNPTCTSGPECTEAGPLTDPGTGAAVLPLTEELHAAFDPNHFRACMIDEINGGRMDRYVSSMLPKCGDARNFAYADGQTASTYWDWAKRFAMGDRVFQSVPGASSANDMYYAQARWAFDDNDFAPLSIGGNCLKKPQKQFKNVHIGDVLKRARVSWTAYAEGYRKVVEASPKCLGEWPQFYDPSDIPFAYYASSADKREHMRDFEDFGRAIKERRLPAVSFIKALGVRTEHPGYGIKMKDGMSFVSSIFAAIEASPAYQKNTLVLVTPDEAGGYFDHVAPPKTSTVDNQPYGPRIYLLALGHFARENVVSHVEMEHASILRFIEWNWLGGKTGQLGARDVTANGIGSLLDPKKTGVTVP